MIVFWLIAALVSTAAAVAIVRIAALGAGAAGGDSAALVLHRRELAEVDDLSERGLLAEDDRAALRAEAARRLLSAAEQAKAAPAAVTAGDRRLVLVIALAAPLLGLGVYALVGAPGLADQPFVSRLAAWRAADPSTLEPAQMAAIVQQIVRERPGEAAAWQALGIAQMQAGQTAAAQSALRKAVALAPDRAELWAGLGESLIGEDGAVGDQAREAFRQALLRDPTNMGARYYMARGALAAGDAAGAVAGWRTLLAQLPDGDPRRQVLEAEIAAAQGAPASSGPSAAQVAAAQGQVGGEQIRAMVESLAQRLAANPDDPEGWARLVRAYTVMGETAKRDAALRTARARYAGQPAVLQALDEAVNGGAR